MKFRWWLVLVILFLSFSRSVPADTLRVDQGNPACDDVAGAPYCNIQTAIDVAVDGDTIQIGAGTYNEKITTTGASITLQGTGSDTTILDGTGLTGSMIEIFGSADIILEDLKFENANDQDDGYGGAIEIGNTDAHLTISNCTFTNNKAGNGGAAFYAEAAGVMVSDSRFFNSEVNFDGGAIDMSDGTLTIHNSEFQNNKALGGDGGAIRMTGSTQLDIKDSFFFQNQANAWGGALSLLGNGSHLIQATTFEKNMSGELGGALLNYLAGGAVTRLSNVTFQGNTADADGGAIYNAQGDLIINNGTITGNIADADNGGVPGAGGGVYNLNAGPAITTVRNTIVAQNQDLSGGSDNCFQTLTSAGYNLIGAVPAGCSFTETVGDITGQDPLLSDLAENGGPTPTQALQEGSPALNQGHCLDTEGNNVVNDQRGSERPTMDCDIGSYEASVCGDDIQAVDEECDDGNTENGDGCDSTCLIEQPQAINNNSPTSAGCRLHASNQGGSMTTPLSLLALACLGAFFSRIRRSRSLD